ncbi:DUF1501 domain-containing protein [Novosphingobium sp. G106]|uniref:DUF1501 domain-containing protein n=1 Tax=Novosphingobium sp. G106 TaxID=2849500 RepID=UPI001C2DBE04|nr:DUF1501 domain-containing protein [Novosphingobium sp. G106]MBV1686761.1 DUF1501 domain-containing protein [Novosphingobium sp. G106]
MDLARRSVLSAIGLGAGFLIAPRMAFATVGGERRFVFVIQRGAADGLNTVIPYGDPDYVRQRGALAIDPGTAIKLDSLFALHPSLVETGKMYAAGQALFVHAVASPYRDRSHFDGQNVLETGGAAPYAVKDGWLNRLVGLLPSTAEAPIAIAPTVPLALRGPRPVNSYAPSTLPQASDDLLARVTQLYAGDAQLHALWAEAMETRGMAADGSGGPRQDPASLGKLAAAFLAKPEGPRIAMIEIGGWDTHSGQNARLAFQLKNLDALLAALRDGLGSAWGGTTVLVATEFGRTVAANGTGGTDHGTASAAMLVGGAVAGKRVVADWPGLTASALYEGRDLKPTQDMDSMIAAVTAESFAIEREQVSRALFKRTFQPGYGKPFLLG